MNTRKIIDNYIQFILLYDFIDIFITFYIIKRYYLISLSIIFFQFIVLRILITIILYRDIKSILWLNQIWK